jgi:hypothetical protein
LFGDVDAKITCAGHGVPECDRFLLVADHILKIAPTEAAHQFANAFTQKWMVICRVNERRIENMSHRF